MLEDLFVGKFRQETHVFFQRAFDALGRVAPVELAVFETVCRRYTARIRHDRVAEIKQERHRKDLVASAARMKRLAAREF